MVPLCARFDTVGPLCRTVEDANLLNAIMAETAPADLRGASLKGKRLAVLKTLAFDDIEGAPKAGFDSAVERLQAAGAQVDRIELPYITEANGMSPTLYPAEAYGTWKDMIEANPEAMFANVRERFRGGRDVGAADLVAA